MKQLVRLMGAHLGEDARARPVVEDLLQITCLTLRTCFDECRCALAYERGDAASFGQGVRAGVEGRGERRSALRAMGHLKVDQLVNGYKGPGMWFVVADGGGDEFGFCRRGAVSCQAQHRE